MSPSEDAPGLPECHLRPIFLVIPSNHQCKVPTSSQQGSGHLEGRCAAYRCRRVHRVVTSPPSITKSAPVRLPAWSLASSTMRAATSSGRSKRLVTASAAACLATPPAPQPLARATVPYLFLRIE